MADLKDNSALEKEIVISSEEELEKTAVRRNSVEDIEDPDPGATPEERKALVSSQ